MRFSEQDFDTMLCELFSKPAVFDMLYRITRIELEPSIKKLVSGSYYLRVFYSAEDLLQDVCAKVIQKALTRFFLKNGPNGEVNRDATGFCAWLHTVAKNEGLDRIKKIKETQGLDKSNDFTNGSIPDIRSAKRVPENTKEDLQNAFDIILSSKNISIYKSLTWLAQSIFLLTYDISRIEANSLLLTEFENKTLFQLYESIVRNAVYLPWLTLTDTQKDIINRALNEPYDEKRVYGEVTYYEFFMSKGGKASISDWINRLDTKIRGRLSKNGTSDVQ